MRVLVPLGTRPEIIKLSPVIRALRDGGHQIRTVVTGQHYDDSLSGSFLEDLGVGVDERWELSGDEASRLGMMLELATRELHSGGQERPDLVLLLGDTNTVPVFCLAARRARVPVAHLEAGLRSFNPTSMEEVNRKVAAACVSLHLAPTDLAARFLLSEGIAPESIRVVGNPVIDVLRLWEVTRKPPESRSGVVFTAHRATNVDDPQRLQSLVSIVVGLARRIGPVTFPVHPRTESRLRQAGSYDRLASEPGVSLLPPLPYRSMLDALSCALVVVTDSGGLQEEASWLGVPVVVLRRSTPRWEGVAAGASRLVGVAVEAALRSATDFASGPEQQKVAGLACPYGDGRTADRVASLLRDPEVIDLIALKEPDYTDGSLPPEAMPGGTELGNETEK